MEAVGTAASILQLAGMATTTSLQVYEFISTIKNAPREIQNLGRDVMDFHKLVDHLKAALDSQEIREMVDRDKQINQSMKDLLAPMAKCQLTCDQVKSKLVLHLHFEASSETSETEPKEKASDALGDQRKQKARIWVRDWMWAFRRKEVFALMSDLDRARSTFSDSMASLTLILTLKKSALTMKDPTASISRKHNYDDDAGSAILQLASVDKPLTIMPSQEEVKKSSDPKLAEELMAAVRCCSTTLVELMLERVDINAQDIRDGRTALSVAAELGNVEITELLLQKGAEVNSRQYSLSKRFIGKAFDERPMLVSGRLPIHWAAIKKHSTVVDLLLQYGANPNARNTAGRSVLQDACMKRDSKSVRQLLEHGADVDARSYSGGWTPVHETAFLNSVEIFKILLEYNPSLNVPAAHEREGFAPLHLSTRARFIEMTRLLLVNDADPNVLMLEDITALHLAAAGGWIDGLNLLLDWGASINAQDARLRETPLHKAARNLEMAAIKRLLFWNVLSETQQIGM
ncbi:hypothetical protein SI65_01349 [Aspergillus cristatus]|uniref:Uncharacterized protein n=1 Tax=Aspergillus cristatus TaxID=573508 RepID=A0A1E3BS15_ASPCR|nr:hypothetical protein SI65_01349 [Aspergillus cristatus]